MLKSSRVSSAYDVLFGRTGNIGRSPRPSGQECLERTEVASDRLLASVRTTIEEDA